MALTNRAILESKHQNKLLPPVLRPAEEQYSGLERVDSSSPTVGSVPSDGHSNHFFPSYDYNQYLNNAQIQQMQQIQMGAQQYTNFQDPHHIAAFKALCFAPALNHSGTNWKELQHMDPQQRMLHLMQQQQYIQQIANQTAIAMSYFLEVCCCIPIE